VTREAVERGLVPSRLSPPSGVRRLPCRTSRPSATGARTETRVRSADEVRAAGARGPRRGECADQRDAPLPRPRLGVTPPSGECRGDIVGIGLDRQSLDEVCVRARGISDLRVSGRGSGQNRCKAVPRRCDPVRQSEPLCSLRRRGGFGSDRVPPDLDLRLGLAAKPIAKR
jgi:hypothetical protein